jgi:hypothetical protein
VVTLLAVKALVSLPINTWILERAGGPRLGRVISSSLPTLLAAALMGTCVFEWVYVMQTKLSDRVLLASAISIGAGTYAIFVCIFVRPVLKELFSLLRSVHFFQKQKPESYSKLVAEN